jgi:hypothetical protein
MYMATNNKVTYCFEIHGGFCSHKVSEKNDFRCPAHHDKIRKAVKQLAEPKVMPQELEGGLSSDRKIEKIPYTERTELARTTNDLSLVDKILREGSLQTKAFLALNPNLQKEHFDRLGAYKSLSIKKNLAQNPNLPVEAFKYLSFDRKGSTQYYVPNGMARDKPISELLGYLEDLDKEPLLLGASLFSRLIFHPMEEDKNHPKRKLFLLYVYDVCRKESEKNVGLERGILNQGKRFIKKLYPGDQEIEEFL